MKVAAIYRVSTEKQVKRDGEDGIPVQRNAVRAFIAQRPEWHLVQEYMEEGVSGFKRSAADRDVLQQALRDARAGHWQALVVFKADRLSRNALEYPVVIDRFRRLGCEVWSAMDAPGGKLLALDTQMDKFVRFLEGWQAETESKNTSIRVSEAMTQMAKEGRWSGGPPPYGFRLNEARRPKSGALALEVDPNEAHVVRLMASLYLDERLGCVLIARELNRRAIPTPTGRPWDDQKVRRILQNPMIAGLPAYNRTRASGDGRTAQNPYDLSRFILPRDEQGALRPVPQYQILDLSQWLSLLQAMQSNQKRGPVTEQSPRHGTRATDGILTGILFCGHCGARLSADVGIRTVQRKDGTITRSRRPYYVCQTHSHRGKEYCDGPRTYGRKRLEQAVKAQLEQLLTMLDPGELVLGAVTTGQEGARQRQQHLEGESTKARRVLQGWLNRMDLFLADPANSPYTEEILNAKIRDARDRQQHMAKQITDLEDELARAGATPEQLAEFAKLSPAWWECFAQAPPLEQKLMVRDLLDRVIVRRGEVEILFRVDLQAFLPKARDLASGRLPPTRIGSTPHREPPSYPVPLPSCWQLIRNSPWRRSGTY